MKNKKKSWRIFCLLVIFGMAGLDAVAQDRSFNDGYDGYGPYGYRTAEEWQYIREVTFRRRGLEDSLKVTTFRRTFENVICPWWMEDLYSPEVIRGQIRRLGYVGYVLNPLTGLPLLTNSWRDSVLLDGAWADIPLDLVVYCRGGAAFDYFLKSDSSRMNFIRAVFDPQTGLINQLHSGRRAAGLHFYLPDFSFREKRAFMQFVRSVSMVIDHYCKDNIRPYAGDKCWLTFTFAPTATRELNYLSGIIGLVDEVQFTAYNEFGFPVAAPQVYTYRNDPTPVLHQSFDQLYLFSFRQLADVENGCYDDLQLLAHAEYSGHHWRIYFLSDVVLFLVLIALVILYNLSSPFYMLVGRFKWLIAPVIITLITEIMIIFLYMIEALSNVQLFFDLDWSTHLYLLVLPVLFILIYLGLKMSGRNKQLP